MQMVRVSSLFFHNAAFGAQSFNSSGYHLVKKIILGGEFMFKEERFPLSELEHLGER